MNLSIAIITYNEENNIERCLKSISTIADEIVIVDNGSTDNTIKVAQKFGAKIFVEEWKGYGKQKQSAIQKCSCDWILSIDADEELKGKELLALTSFLKEERSTCVYKIKRKNFCFGRLANHCYKDDYPIRLFKKDTANFNQNDIHETLETTCDVRILPMFFLNHYTYATLSDYLEKMKVYTQLIANQKYERGKKISLLTILFKPPFSFFSMYILKGGFLDGRIGFIVSVLHSYYKFSVYTNLYLRKRKS